MEVTARFPHWLGYVCWVDAPGATSGGGEEFSTALRSLITTRGLPLEAIRAQLAQRGHRLSVTTLSYWQSGRSQPERAASLDALVELERVLNVPDGFLLARIQGVAKEPDWVVDAAGPDFPPPRTGVLDIMNRLDLSLDDGLHRVSLHDTAEVHADRTAGLHVVRQFMRAERDGIESFPVWYTPDDRGAIPYVQARANCRIGRIYELRSIPAVAAEMVFDRPLRHGEMVTTEHAMESVRISVPQVQLARGLARPAERITMEARFHLTAFPATAYRSFTTPAGERTETPLQTPANRLRLDVEHPEPGFYALEWSW